MIHQGKRSRQRANGHLMFDSLQKNHYRAILADPPWAFNLWWGGRTNRTPAGVPSRATVPHYRVMKEDELNALPVGDLAADDCVRFSSGRVGPFSNGRSEL